MRWAGSIGYRVIGARGQPWLVLCHGMALDHREFLGVAEALADRWQVVLWDMPGHGVSQPGPADYSVGAMADALAVVLDAAGVEGCVLLGFSFGGVVAQALVRRQPERLRAVILHGCFMAYLQPAPLPGWLVTPMVALLFGLRPWRKVQRDFVRRCALTPAGQAAIGDAPARLGRAGFLAMTRALLRANRPDPDFRVAVPVLLIRGEADGYAEAIDAGFDALRLRSPQAHSVVIAAAGHCAHLDQAAAFRAAVEDILATLPASDPTISAFGPSPAN